MHLARLAADESSENEDRYSCKLERGKKVLDTCCQPHSPIVDECDRCDKSDSYRSRHNRARPCCSRQKISNVGCETSCEERNVAGNHYEEQCPATKKCHH